MSRGEPTQVFTMASLLPDAATVESVVADGVEDDADVVEEDAAVDEVPKFSVVDEVSLDVAVEEHDASTAANTRPVKGCRREVFFMGSFDRRTICSS